MADNRQGMSREEAGRKGGETTAREHDMSEIGKKGGEATKAKYGPDFYSEIGEEGAKQQPREAKARGGRNSHSGGQNR